MSLAITHFAVGAVGILVFLATVRPRSNYRTTLAVASGCWALVPDLFYLLPGAANPLRGPIEGPVGNVFWFHSAMDALVHGRGTRTNAAVALVLLAGAALLADCRGTRRTADSSTRTGVDETVPD